MVLLLSQFSPLLTHSSMVTTGTSIGKRLAKQGACPLLPLPACFTVLIVLVISSQLITDFRSIFLLWFLIFRKQQQGVSQTNCCKLHAGYRYSWRLTVTLKEKKLTGVLTYWHSLYYTTVYKAFRIESKKQQLIYWKYVPVWSRIYTDDAQRQTDREASEDDVYWFLPNCQAKAASNTCAKLCKCMAH